MSAPIITTDRLLRFANNATAPFEVDALQCVDENKVGRLDVDPEFFAEFSLCREIRCLFGFDMATDDVPDTRIPGPVRGASADQNHA